MKRWLLAGIVTTLAACGLWLAYAGDPDTINPIPQSNASFLSDLQTALKEEAGDRFAEQFSGFVVQNGQHGTGAGLTGNPGSLIAYPGGARITETATITYSDASVCWTIANRATTGNLSSFVRVAGTHYLTDCVSVPQPALPADSVYLMKVTTAAGAISAVQDLRLRVPYAMRVEAVADLPADAFFGRLVWVDATKSYYVGTGGTTYVRLTVQPSGTALTAGSVLFSDVNGRLAQDNANLFWDDTNNRLGIGTVTPATPLQVVGAATLPTIAGPVAFDNTVSSTKACATSFTRISPNYCMVTIQEAMSWADATACTARTVGSTAVLPADAKAVYLSVEFNTLSNNAVGPRVNDVKFWQNAGCTTFGAIVRFGAREEVAVTAGTVIDEATFPVIAPLAATNTIRTTQQTAGGNGNADVGQAWILGYFD